MRGKALSNPKGCLTDTWAGREHTSDDKGAHGRSDSSWTAPGQSPTHGEPFPRPSSPPKGPLKAPEDKEDTHGQKQTCSFDVCEFPRYTKADPIISESDE